jgi:hypothetical protein
LRFSEPLVWYHLRWPRRVEAEALRRAVRVLATTAGHPLVIESRGTTQGVDHILAVPLGRAGSVVHQLRAAVPGLAVVSQERRVVMFDRAVALRLSTKRRSLWVDDLALLSGAVLTALSHVAKDEELTVQWILGLPLSPRAVPNRGEPGPEALTPRTVLQLLINPLPFDPEARQALRAKQFEPGWKASGRIAVRAESTSRQRQLIRQVIGALKTSEAAGVAFWVHGVGTRRVAKATVPWRWPLRLNAAELAGLSSWPIEETAELPVVGAGSRLLAPSRRIPGSGRVVVEASFPGSERPLSLSPSDALRHLHVLGPTGSGKSTLLLGLILQDIAAGRGVVVIEPKGDLIAETLRHIPEARIGDVVVIDPTDADHAHPVGINPLTRSGRSAELVADQLLGVFHSLFAAHWGPRTSDILASALLTLARTPDMTLVALPLLLADPGFRRRVLAGIEDPIGLEPFWASYEAMSEPERAAAIAPAMRRLRPFLLRPELRAIIGQARPRFDLREVFTKRLVLLVNLSKGTLGPETAALLGSLLVTGLWQATLGRSRVPPEHRHVVPVYVDEFQDYLRLPVDFSDALAMSRGLGVAFVLAHQFLHQLEPQVRSSVLANVQSRVAFRLPSEDARIMAAGGPLEPEDFQSLGAYECYAQLVASGAVQPWCSATTLLPPPTVSDAEQARTASRLRFGTNRDEVEAEIRRLVLHRHDPGGDDLSPRRRHGGDR